MVSLILSDYDLKLKEETKLYRRGTREQWDAETLNWALPTSLGKVEQAAGAKVLSQFLYGEQASLLLAGQLLSLVEDFDARYFLATQAMDEARHVEVFQRYITRMGSITAPQDSLRQLVDRLLMLQSVDEKIVGMHILLEGMAQEVFHTASRVIPDPLLQEMLAKVLMDESRHIAFGTVYLKKVVARLDEAQLERLRDHQGECAALIASSLNELAEPSAQFGINVWEVTERAMRVHFHRLQEIGLMQV